VHHGLYVPLTVRLAFWATKSPEVELAPRGFLWMTQSSTDRKIDLPLALVQLPATKEYYHTFLVKRFGKLFYGYFYLLPVRIVVVLP